MSRKHAPLEMVPLATDEFGKNLIFGVMSLNFQGQMPSLFLCPAYRDVRAA